MSKKRVIEEVVPKMQERVKPKTKGQAEYLRILVENTVTFVTGDAGTGKSYLALGLAAEYLLEHRYDTLIVARPAVEASKKGLGFLPGNLNEKLDPYVLPAIKHLKRFLGNDMYHNMIRDERIKFETLEYMRGHTFDYSFMLLEEAQNADFEQLKMFVTRIGTNSKILINGDIDQTDLKYSGDESDLFKMMNKVKHLAQFGIAELTEEDIVRNPLIIDFLRAVK
jgi:phosphate starvation-inducible PhoH-like protein